MKQPVEKRGMQPVVLINPVEADDETEVPFLEQWIACARVLREQEGMISLTLHRAINPFSRFRFVIVEEWRSEEARRQAVEVLAAHGGSAGSGGWPCPHFPGLYRVFSR